MNKYHYILIITLFTFTGCSSISVHEKMKGQLCEAFNEDSIPLLNLFFEEWHNSKKPFSDFEFNYASDTVKMIYKVFNNFCNREIEKNPGYYNSHYCIIQNQIKYQISTLEHLNYPIPDSCILISKTITDFRPFPNKIKNKTVYKSKLYDSVLEDFIKSDCGKENETKYYDLTWRGWPRANFLEQVVHIRAAMMGFSYQTLPFVSLDFNKNMNEVIIHSSLASSWTSELFVLSEGKWKFIKSFYTSVN